MICFLVLCSVFLRQKVAINENVNFTDYGSRIQLLDSSKLIINQKNDNGILVFLLCFVSLVKFSYWSTFHVIIITGSGNMTIFFYKWLNRNSEIGNNLPWVWPNIRTLGQVRVTKCGINVSYKIFLITTKCQGNSFYRFWVIKGKALVFH